MRKIPSSSSREDNTQSPHRFTKGGLVYLSTDCISIHTYQPCIQVASHKRATDAVTLLLM